MTKRFENILETIGNTPIVRINRLAPEGVNLYVKMAEAFNPLGSVKDRLALAVIEAAEKSGELKPGQTVVEATSGNTGIGLAMVCAAKGYPCVLTMAEPFSVERRKLMRFLGAKVVITPAAQRAVGMMKKTQELVDTRATAGTGRASSRTRPIPISTRAPPLRKSSRLSTANGSTTGSPATAPAAPSKAWRASSGRTAGDEDRRLRARRRPAARQRHRSGAQPRRHAVGASPRLQAAPDAGWTPDFIPKLTGDAVTMKLVDRIIQIPNPDALRCSRELAAKEGVFVGITSVGTFAGALKVAAEAEKGANILACCRTRPSATSAHRSSPIFRPT